MKKTTFLKVILLVFIFLQSFLSYSQSLVSYVSGAEKDLAMDIFRIENNTITAKKQVLTNEKSSAVGFMAAVENPIIKYAQLPYAGQVSICPNNGKELPKLFLCGGNDSRLIETGITDAQSITWERFISGGSCVTVSNSDCANESAAAACWVQIATGKDYLANTAGQFRVTIIDKTSTPYVFYFNVYQNTLVPTAVAKSDIVKYGTGSCQIDGKITVGGFGSGYEYSFTTGTTAGTWQDSNVFTTGTPGNYTAFIRIKGVVGSCEFKVINLEIKTTIFEVKTSVTSPKCSGGQGSIQVVTNDVKQQYKYEIFNSASALVGTFGPTEDLNYTFTGLNSGTYRVVTSVVGIGCMVDTKTNIVIANAPAALTSGVSTTPLTACSTGKITITTGGGSAPYKFFVNVDGAGFVPNLTNVVTVSKSGIYVIRVEDLNGCFVDKTVTVGVEDKPEYRISKLDGNCTGAQGQITVNVTNAKGYSLQYSKDNGANYQISNVFTSLASGIYNVKVQYKKPSVNGGAFCSDPSIPITIGASTVLTASAGVAELSGCGPNGNKLQGLVRITNPQGGVPFSGADPYLYSYDGRNTWITSNSLYINPGGPYTFYIKDAVGCEYAMSGIILEPKPDDPKIEVSNAVFNCDGSATSIVTVTNSGSTPRFSYNYFIDGTPNTVAPTNIFKNVTQGDHTITVTYDVLTVPTYSNLLQENFGSGPPTITTGISSAYCFNDQRVNEPYVCGTRSVEDGQYSVASFFWRSDTAWFPFKDHTSNGTDPNGRYLLVNIGAVAGKYGILYSKPITDVILNQPVTVDLYVANLLNKGASGVPPIVRFELLDQFGNVVARQDTGEIAKDPDDPNRTKWVPISVSLNPGSNTNLTFVIRSGSEVTGGNDLLIDDILVRQIPKSCNTVASFPIVVDGSKAFSAGITAYKDVKCNGEKNGEITLSARNFDPVKGFQYQVDGGAWKTVIPSPAATSGSVTLPNLPDKIYNINIRYDNSTGSCTFPVKQEIKNPTALEIKADITKDATCIVGATITAAATEGTPGYQYQLIKADGSILFPFQASGIFIDVPVGDYTVVAKDLNACQTAIPASVSVVAAIPPTATFEPSNLCFDANAEIKIKVTGGVGPYTYTTSFDGGTPTGPSATFDGPSFTYTAAVAGIYTFEVTDSFGCKTAVISQTINAKLTTVTPVTTALDCDVAPGGSPEAVITGTISGGTAPFVVTLVSRNATGTLDQPTAVATANERTFTYSIAVAGTYNFEIKDANNCITTSETTINPLVPITLGSTNVNPKCNTSSDGTIQLNPVGGSGGFTYSVDGTIYNNTSFFPGLSAGTPYTYYVKDSNKCIKSITVTLTAPLAIAATADITTPYTCDGSATISVTSISGGTGIYNYTLNRGGLALASNTTGVFNNISVVGNYTVTITDSNGCPATATPVLTISALNGPTDLTFTYKIFDCSTNTSEFNVNLPLSGGGQSPVRFQIITVPASIPVGSALYNYLTQVNADGQYSGVPAGVYTFEVTDKNNCKYQEIYELKPEPPIVVSGKLINNVKCLGSDTGSVEYSISGFATTYSYSINGGTTSGFVNTPKITLPNLAAGDYTISVTDKKTGCVRTAKVSVLPPDTELKIDLINPTAITCLVSGGVVINTSGGWGSNSYTVTGSAPVVAAVTQSTNDFKNLTAGIYTATVTDLNGCVVTQNFTIADKVLPTASIGTSDFCYDSTDKATLVVSPETQTNYVYSINGGATQGNGTFSGLTPGKYTIRVTDTSTGCYKDLDEETIALPVSASTKIIKDLDCSTTTPDASIEVTISNGYAPYTYKVSTTAGSFTGTVNTVTASSFTYNAGTAGTYYFEITDNKGCTTVVSRTINAIVLPTLTTTQVNVKCKDDATGSIIVSGIPASGTYEYSKDNGANYQPTNTFSGLLAGTYQIVIRDTKSCKSLPVDVLITEPANALTASATATPFICSATNTQQAATITVTAINGTPFTGNTYLYSYNGGTYVASKTYTTNSAGDVSINVKDANGCIAAATTVTIAPFTPPTALSFAPANAITCTATTTDVEVSVTGGVGPFTYEIITPASAISNISGASNGIFTALSPNTYTFKVTDANGCTITGTYKVDAVLPITVTGLLVANVSCNTGTDGSIRFTVDGNTTGYVATLTNSLGATIAIVPTITSSGSSYILDYAGLPAEIYTLNVSSPTACPVDDSVEVFEPTLVTITGTNATKVFCTKPISTITVSATGGTAPLEYAVVKQGVTPVAGDYQGSTIFNKDTTVDGLFYDVYVKDKNGCPATMGTVSVISNPVPAVTALGAGCLGTSYSITATPVPAAGLFGPLTYSLNGGGFVATTVFSITTAGDYTITIKDGNGCTATSNVVTVAPKLTLSSFLNKDVTCASVAPFTNDAQITLTAGGGTGAYSYKVSIDGGAFSAPVATDPYSFSGNIFTTSLAGSYQFEVSDSNAPSCAKVTTTAIVVTNPVLPVIADTTIPSATGVTVTQKIRCYGDATAAIAIAIDNTKGVGPYVFNVLRTAPTTQDYKTQTSGLTAGDYTIIVTDAKGCTDTEDITIDDAKPIVVIHHEVPVECVDDGTGTGVNVTKGSIIIDGITDGISSVGGTGGTAPYTYYVTGNNYNQFESNVTGTTSVQFDVVDFGLYQINVVDANGCSMLVQDVLVATKVDNLDIAVNLTVDCTTLGTAEVKIATALAGTGPFHFAIYTGPPMLYSAINPLWKNEQEIDIITGLPVDTPGSRKAYFSGLIPGVKYTFIVYDENTKCYYYQTANVIPVNTTIAIANLIPQNVTCQGNGDGKVSFDLSTTYGVDTDVTYQIFDSQSLVAMGPAVPVTIPATGLLPVGPVGSLPRGNYFVVIKEALGATNPGCSTASTVFNIKESTLILDINATILKQPNTCDLTAGIITAIAKDGTATAANPYLYQITTANSEPAIGDINWNVKNTFTLLAANTYYIWVKDAYNCIKMVSKTLTNDVAPTLDALPTVAVCPADLPKTITISGAVFVGSSKTYAIGSGLPAVAVAGTYKTNPDFVLTASGNYTFFIKDDNGCVAKAPYTINDEITSTLSVTKQLDCTVGTEDATIHGVVGGGLGTGNFSYTVKIGSGAFGASVPIVASTFDYSAATADTYTFVITDGTCSVTETIVVDPKVPTVFNTAVVDVKCFGDNTGSISVDVTSGEGPFEYKLTGGPVSYVYQDSNQFNLLTAATTYIVTVRSKGNLCEYTKTVTVGEPLLALAVDTPTIIKLKCGPVNVPQSATVTLNGAAGTGTGAFEYSFNGSAYGSTNVFTVNDNGNTQTIPYGVRDANNCEVTGTVTIDKLDPPVFNVPLFAQTTVTCLAPTSTVTVSSTNGVGTLTYETIAPSPLPLQSNTTGNFTGLAPGDYTFLVTDTNSCTDQESYRVNDVTKIDLQVTSQTDVICNATATGTATFAVTGFGTGVGTYSVTVNGLGFPLVAPNSNNLPTLSLTGLAANTYLVRVTDDVTGCYAEQTVTIANPTAVLAGTNNVTPLGCTTMGAVTINATGGWGSYEYTLTTPLGTVITQNTNVFNNLSDITGAYTTSVKDVNGCIITDAFTLLAPVNPSATIAASSNYCYDGGASTTLVVTAGSASTFTVSPYEYSIDNGVSWQTSDTFSGLTPGSYAVVVKDAFGCLSTAFTEMIQPQLFATAIKTKELDCTITTPDGTIRITPTDGYSTYTYKVSTDGGTTFTGIPVTNSAYTDYTVTAAGSYVFEVTDSKGCQYATTPAVVMTAPTPVTLAASDIASTPVDCNASQGTANNGTITVNLDLVANNNPDYTYTLNQLTPVTNITTQSTNVFTGLTAGNYEVVVTSARACFNSIPVPVTIAAVAPVVASASAAAFSCVVDPTITTAVVTGGGGTGTYSFSEDGINYFTSNSSPVDNKYTFDIVDNGLIQNPIYSVKDSKGCIQTTTLLTVLNPLPKLISVTATRSAIAGSQIDCINGRELIQIDVVGGSIPSDFKYEVSVNGLAYTLLSASAGTPFTYSALSAGNYYQFKITDNITGCDILSNAYDVPLFNKMLVTASAAANVDCNANATGAIEINITGYSGGYSYEILNGATSVFTGTGNTSTNPFVLPHGLTAGTNYTVEVTETAYPQCTVPSNLVIITEPAPLDLTGLVVDVKNQNCNNVGAVLTVDVATIAGGTPGYEYAFVASGVDPTGLYSTSKTKTIATTATASAPDQIDVYVKDANGCFSSIKVAISLDPMPTVTATLASQCASPYTINVSGTGVETVLKKLEYSLDGNSFTTSTALTVNSPGKYTVTVRDANQCTAPTTTQVTIFEPLQLQYEITTPPICNGNQGVVTLTATGGTIPASYQYSSDDITYNSGLSANVFNNLAPRATPYTFYVKDMGTLCIKTVDVLIAEPNTFIAFTLDKTDVICNGESNGSITVNMAAPTTAVNNNPVYTYTINPPLGTLVGNVFINLPADTYTVTVTSGKGCLVTATETVAEPPLPITVAASVSDYGCTTGNGTNYATITVALPTGGSTNYTVYEFIKTGNPDPVQRGDNATYIETDLLGGSYVINVYDDKGCSGSTTATINPFIGIDFASPTAVMVTKAITCIDTEDIKVHVAFTGGAAVPLVYTIVATVDNPALGIVGNAIPYPTTNDPSGEFTNLTVGSYAITVTNPVTGCSIKTIHYVNEPNTFDIIASNVQNVVCYGTATGSVDLTFVDNQVVPSDDAGAFEYTITGPTGPPSPLVTTTGVSITIPNLPAGVYNVKAKLVNTPSCEVETNFTIAQPTAKLEIFETHTPITCDPGSDGTISVTADGGWPGNYQYELVGVGPGAISVAYSDQFFFENLTPGTYTVNVMDVNGCVETATVTLKDPDLIVVTASATAPMLACNGDTNGEIIVDLPIGGQGTNYSYILNYISANPAFSSASQTTPVFSGLSAGTYSVTVIDGLGCISQPTADIIIGEPTKVEATLVLAKGITCLDPAELTLSATGGTGPYEYSTDMNFPPGSFASVTATPFSVGLGNHQYYVRDANGCVSYISNNVTINALTPLSISTLDFTVIYCKGSATGIIDATAVGGLGNYFYTLLDSSKNPVRPAQATGYFDLLPAGKYIVRVDSDDCQYDSAVFEIKEPDFPLVQNNVVTNVTCEGERNGKIEITASGGTGKITYAISPNLNQTFEGNVSGGHVFNNLKPGTYDYIVQDENGCFEFITGRVITEPKSIFVTTIPGTDIPEICAGDADGAFSINITEGSAPYSVSLDDVNGVYTAGTLVQTQFDFPGLSGSEHIVYVRDANNCTTEHTVILGEPVTLNPQATLNYDCVSNSASNSVTVTVDASNMPPDLDYALDGSTVFQASNVFTNVTPGQHTIDVRHANGCIKQVVFDVLQVDPLTLTLADGGLNEIVATATGGGGNYQYTLDGESYGSQSKFIIYKSGDYTVTVTDANGCTATATRYFEFIDIKIPNVFTPNGDGNNDTWAPTNTINYKDLVFYVYDRYGRKLGSYRESQFWDGKYNGNELPSGDYWYVIKIRDAKDAREFVGHFTLYR